MSVKPLFEARNLHKRFGEQVVLEKIDLAFEKGQISGIMGPNGAGKTTCFNVLTGRYKPNRGSVFFDGENITSLPPRIIARRGVSRSFQTINLFDEYTTLENILVAVPKTREHGFNMFRDLATVREAHEQAFEVLEKVGLKDKAHEQADQLSYGDRRALEIGLALASEPRILFLDEPTSGMGSEATSYLAELILELKRNYTIVIIEHDMRFLFRLADKISVIHWGQVIASGTPEELQANKWVRTSNLGKLS